MDLINVKNGTHVLQCFYTYENGIYSFEKDIQIGDWIVSRYIKLCGPTSSPYKYDFRNYFELVITDCNGESRTFTWNPNIGCKYLKAYRDGDSTADALPYFFAKHPLFSSKDWKDYENVDTLRDIELIFQDAKISSGTKLLRIAAVIKRFQK